MVRRPVSDIAPGRSYRRYLLRRLQSCNLPTQPPLVLMEPSSILASRRASSAVDPLFVSPSFLPPFVQVMSNEDRVLRKIEPIKTEPNKKQFLVFSPFFSLIFYSVLVI